MLNIVAATRRRFRSATCKQGLSRSLIQPACSFTLRRLAGMLQLDQVHFRGHVANIKEVWEQNHLLVLPSRYEGLPLALVESMWCGRPAVVTEVAGNTEVCVDNVTGFVAPAPTVADSLTQ